MSMKDLDNFGIDDIIKEIEMICPLCKKRMVKHIIKEGARYHVHRYSLINDKAVVDCSTKNCEDNHGYGKCVPEEKDPDYGLSFKECMNKILRNE
jgi:hypothetical protein